MARPWMDFAYIREHADFATVLAHYSIAHAPGQNQVSVLCPFHDDRRPSLSINLEAKIFHCFACQAKGDILDFVTMIEKISLPDAARIIAQCCMIPLDGQSSTNTRPANSADNRNKGMTAKSHSGEAGQPGGKASLCCSASLDPTHRFLRERGVTPELIKEFGLGFCAQGRLRGRVCIPIHSPDGAQVLAYAGRWVNDHVPDGIPRYLLPRGFKKNQVLYNYHRVVGARHLVIVEGYWSVFRLHALHVPAVALMGTSLSASQIDLLCQSGARRITLLLDADAAGGKATKDLLPRLSSLFFIHTPALPDAESPDMVSENLLLEAVRS
jgi:DNA primase